MCTVEPDVPVIVSEYVPAEKLLPLIVRVAVAGKELSELGLILQLPVPYVFGQLRRTVPMNPSCDVIEMAPVVPLLPAFISGNGAGSVIAK
ncbi:MAG TPA: hypothetical protein VM715_05810, partial [Candidatus Acidoferrum sp.]|nr:hypothetical protein [Candidatus Acidoferrum sp.]